MFHFDILSLVAGIPGLLMALVVHEYAHALIADKMGDSTPRMTGRLTLNPIAHIESHSSHRSHRPYHAAGRPVRMGQAGHD